MLTPGQRVGSYQIVRLLGQGGMGAVFEGYNEDINRRVAIKVLHQHLSSDPGVASRFLNEARAVNLVNHLGLVAISEFGRLPDGMAYIVMEYLEGESLRARLRRERPLPVPEAVGVARQMAAALRAAHREGIVHRDLKPDNVMLVPDQEREGTQRARLLDFGIAKVTDSGGAPTATGSFLGTPTYISPEQCRDAKEATDRADVYSLGIILYEMLAGRPPFVAEGHAALLGMHLFDEPPALGQGRPEIPPGLAALVHEMLAKAPTARPDMGQVGARLAAFGAAPERTAPPGGQARAQVDALSETSAAPASTLGRGAGQVLPAGHERPRQLPRALFGVAVGLLVVAGAVGLWRLRPGQRTPTTGMPPVARPALVEPRLGLRALSQFHDASGAARTLLKEPETWEAAAADLGRVADEPGAPLRFRSGRGFCLGRARLLRGQVPAATLAFRQAVALEEGWAAAHVGLADALEQAGDRAGALGEVRRAQEIEPDWWVPVASVAAMYAHQDQLADAIQAYRRALSLAKDEPTVLDGLALALHASQLDSEADEVAKRALERDPDMIWSRVLRAERALERNRPAEALTEATRACALSPRTAAAQLARADALVLLRRRDEARGVYRTFLSLVTESGALGLPPERVTQVRKALAAGHVPNPRGQLSASGDRSRVDRSRAPPPRSRPRTKGVDDTMSPIF